MRGRKYLFNNWLYALMVLVTVAAVYWKSQPSGFPYAGRWVGYQGAQKTRLILSFSKAGKCSFTIDNISRSTSYNVAYRMAGDSAILWFKLPDETLMESRATPEDNGDRILLKLLKVTGVERRTGQKKEHIYHERPIVLLRTGIKATK